MNVVDFFGWLEYFASGPNADFFAAEIEAVSERVVPSISIYEVFKLVLGQRGEGETLQAVAAMQQGLVVDLDASLALRAARISVGLKLPMADSVILATARARCHAVDARFGFRGHRRCQVRRKKLTGELISAAQKGGEQHNIWSLRSERDSQVRMNSANAAALLSTSLADKLRANGVR